MFLSLYLIKSLNVHSCVSVLGFVNARDRDTHQIVFAEVFAFLIRRTFTEILKCQL